MAKNKHMMERVIDKAVIQFDKDLNSWLKSMVDETGRPAFMVKPSPKEQILRYLDPLTRQQIVAEKMQMGGQEAVDEYNQHMTDLIARRAAKGSIITTEEEDEI